ncbi:MAG: NUDIX hydrolase [Myxococcota bacterium]
MAAPIDIQKVRRRLAGLEPNVLEDAPRRAAVAAILRAPGAGEDTELLLIRRAEHPHDPWSGHMALPGGRHEPHDPSLLATAQRETLEEVGVDLERAATLLGRLDDVPAVARGRPVGMVIRPYVFELTGEVRIHPNYEVAETLWAPLGPLIHGEADTTRPYPYEGREHHLPAFDVQGRVVWGLTYQMLQSFFRVLRTPG